MKSLVIFMFILLCSCSIDMKDVDVISDGENIEVDATISLKLPSHVSPNSDIKIACDAADFTIIEMDYKSAKVYDVTNNEWNNGYKKIHDTIKGKEGIFTCAIVEIDKYGYIINYFNSGFTNIKEKIIQKESLMESICNYVKKSNENGILTRYVAGIDNCFYQVSLYLISTYGEFKFMSIAYPYLSNYLSSSSYVTSDISKPMLTYKEMIRIKMLIISVK